MKNKKHVSNKNFRVGVFLAIFFAASFFVPSPARAGYWGESIYANQMLYYLEEMSYKIKGIVLSVVKNEALKVINEQVLGMVNGTWGQGSLVIEDWRDFIYTQSSKKAEDVVLNDFFPKMFSGKGSGGNYTASSGGLNSVNSLVSSYNTIKNYPEYLQNIGKNTLDNLKGSAVKYSLDQVCPNPSDALSKGDYACFSAIMQPQNNPRGIPLLTEEKYIEEIEKNAKIAETQAGITGYKPQTNAQGIVVTPPQTISDIVSTIQTLPAMAIAVAENPEELITGVIQSYVNSLVQKTLSKVGLGSVTSSLGEAVSDGTNNMIDYSVGTVFNGAGVGTDVITSHTVGSQGSGTTTRSITSSPEGPSGYSN